MVGFLQCIRCCDKHFLYMFQVPFTFHISVSYELLITAFWKWFTWWFVLKKKKKKEPGPTRPKFPRILFSMWFWVWFGQKWNFPEIWKAEWSSSHYSEGHLGWMQQREDIEVPVGSSYPLFSTLHPAGTSGLPGQTQHHQTFECKPFEAIVPHRFLHQLSTWRPIRTLWPFNSPFQTFTSSVPPTLVVLLP